MIKINRDISPGNYSLVEIFDGLQEVNILTKVFKTKEEIDDVFLKTKVIVEDSDHYMYVKNDDATIVIGFKHLKNSDSKILYLDIVHELVHVMQQRKGLDLYDKSFAYVDRPTEIEAYEIAVMEAKNLGMSKEEILEYLVVEWITPEEHKRLISHMDLF
jgi:hypothetical protein